MATAVFQLEMPPLLEIQVQQESTQKKMSRNGRMNDSLISDSFDTYSDLS